MVYSVLREMRAIAKASVESKQDTVNQQCHKDEKFVNADYCTENQERDSKYFEDMANNNGLNGLYRPRSALARALYEKQRNDRQLQEYDQNEMRCQPRGLRWTSSASNFTGCLTVHPETQQCKHCCFTARLASKMVVAIRADLAQDSTTCKDCY
ncbi:hypothetical protein MSG28_005319 [Choristoneura fumiferana]|uniref:Uncharacterized protein n=1 Tax=Choristoneura fumiferana TaxID=7141 RepID=A0ACC0JRG5_CHOFU|nr:hypothetical protein MSG28_005319 [Choristoneura fumiferana]